MRKILLATAATACLTLTACNPGGGGSGNKPSASQPAGGQPSTATPAPTPTPASTPGDGSATPGSDPGAGQAALALGVPSRTVGTKLVGILEITPTTVVYTKEEMERPRGSAPSRSSPPKTPR